MIIKITNAEEEAPASEGHGLMPQSQATVKGLGDPPGEPRLVIFTIRVAVPRANGVGRGRLPRAASARAAAGTVDTTQSYPLGPVPGGHSGRRAPRPRLICTTDPPPHGRKPQHETQHTSQDLLFGDTQSMAPEEKVPKTVLSADESGPCLILARPCPASPPRGPIAKGKTVGSGRWVATPCEPTTLGFLPKREKGPRERK